MLTRLSSVVATMLVMASGAVVQAWTAYEASSFPGPTWTFDEPTETIKILEPGTYRFWATTGLAGDPLAAITSIAVEFDLETSGWVTVSIARSSGQPGCTSLGQMNLTGPRVDGSTVIELRVQNDAATIAGITAGTLSGVMNVGGAVQNALHFTTLQGDIVCGNLGDLTAAAGSDKPEITVAGVYNNTMSISGVELGAVSLGGIGPNGAVTLTARVGSAGLTINGGVEGALSLIGNTGFSSQGEITVYGPIAPGGSLFAQRDLSKAVTIKGEVGGELELRKVPSANVVIEGNVGGTVTIGDAQFAFVTPALTIEGDLTGLVDIIGTIQRSTGTGRGYVHVEGALGPNADPGQIVVRGGLYGTTIASHGYVCINSDGCSDSALDLWFPGSTVRLGSTDYSAADDAVYLHAGQLACGPGDMNGDLSRDFSDIDPFVAMIGVVPSYPGLVESTLFRADINRDGLINFADIDPFVALIGTPCSCGTTEMMAMASFGAPESGTLTRDPLALAEALRDNVSAANMPALLDAIAQLVATPPAGAQVDWPLVQQHLQ